MQSRKPSARKRAARPSDKSGRWLTSELKNKIALESKALGLSRREYLSLVLSVSKSMRNSLETNESIDWKQLAKWVDSPLWPIIMGVISRTVASVISADEEGEASDSKSRQPQSGPSKIAEPSQQKKPLPAPPRQVPIERPTSPYIVPWPDAQMIPPMPEQRAVPRIYHNGYL